MDENKELMTGFIKIIIVSLAIMVIVIFCTYLITAFSDWIMSDPLLILTINQ